MIFKKATTSDANAISKLVNSGYRGDISKNGWTTEADFIGGQRTDPDKITEMILDSNSHIELGFNDNLLECCVYLKKENSETCYLGMLTVNPYNQTQGLGKLLLARSEEIARSWNCKKMRITVIDVRTELIPYYERRGYVKTGHTEPFPDNDERFGIPKVKGLMFVELVKPLNI